MQNFLGFWKKIDPYKDYAQLEKHPKFIGLQICALCISCASFFAFLAFSLDSYSKTPEPSKATVERVFPSNPPKALFQFTIMLPVTSGREVKAPTAYRSPLSDVLTVQKAVEYTLDIASTAFRTGTGSLQFEVYSFPVYGTVDPTTGTSTLLYFQPANYRNLGNNPLLFAVGPPGIVFSRLDAKEKNEGINYDLILSDPNSNTQFIQMYERLDLMEGLEIHVEMVLEKTVRSNLEVNYTASFAAPPLLTPKTNENISPQRFISVSVKSNVNVITFSPKNIFTFIGSIGGIFPIFVSIGGIIASLLWSRMEQKALDGGPGINGDVKAQKGASKPSDISVEMRSFQEEPFDKASSIRIKRIETQMNRFEAIVSARFKSFEAEQAEILVILQELSNTINGRAMQEVAASDADVSQAPHRDQARVIGALAPDRSRPKLLAPRASAQQGSRAGNPPNVLEIPQMPPHGRSSSRGRYAGNGGSRDA
jgi:hypothetical protein